MYVWVTTKELYQHATYRSVAVRFYFNITMRCNLQYQVSITGFSFLNHFCHIFMNIDSFSSAFFSWHCPDHKYAFKHVKFSLSVSATKPAGKFSYHSLNSVDSVQYCQFWYAFLSLEYCASLFCEPMKVTTATYKYM